MTRIRALFALLMIVAALGAVPRTQAAPPHCWADHLTCVTPTDTPSPTDTATPSPTATSVPGVTMTAPSVVQSFSQGALSTTFTTVTTGDIILVLVYGSGTPTGSITDGASNSYSSYGAQGSGGSSPFAAVSAYIARAATDASNLTVNASALSPIDHADFIQITGGNPYRPIDVFKGGSVAAGTALTVTTADTTLNATDLVVTALASSTNQTISTPSGYTGVGSIASTNSSVSGYKTVSGTGTQSAAYSFASSNVAALVLAFRPVATSPLVTRYDFNFNNSRYTWSTSGTAIVGETAAPSDTAIGNPVNAMSSDIKGKSLGPTAVSFLAREATFQDFGVPANATVIAITVDLDWSCTTFATGGTSSWTSTLTYGASTDTSAAVNVTATTAWVTRSNQHSVSGLALASSAAFGLKIEPTFRTGAVNAAEVKVGWDNVKVTITYTLPMASAPKTIVQAVTRAAFY